jgi:excisionase family DNA binding protein
MQLDTKVEILEPWQVAELFHVNVKTITRWASEGKLPHIRTLGGHRRYRRDEIEQIILSTRVEARQ